MYGCLGHPFTGHFDGTCGQNMLLRQDIAPATHWCTKRALNVQKWSVRAVFCTFWFRNVLRATTACSFSSLIWPDGSAPAALASLLFDPPEPQIIGKPRCFATFLPFRVPISSSFWFFLFSDLLSSTLLFSLTLPITASHLSILSEVWLLNFLRLYAIMPPDLFLKFPSVLVKSIFFGETIILLVKTLFMLVKLTFFLFLSIPEIWRKQMQPQQEPAAAAAASNASEAFRCALLTRRRSVGTGQLGRFGYKVVPHS